jgi:hypothetical protein
MYWTGNTQILREVIEATESCHYKSFDLNHWGLPKGAIRGRNSSRLCQTIGCAFGHWAMKYRGADPQECSPNSIFGGVTRAARELGITSKEFDYLFGMYTPGRVVPSKCHFGLLVELVHIGRNRRPSGKLATLRRLKKYLAYKLRKNDMLDCYEVARKMEGDHFLVAGPKDEHSTDVLRDLVCS